MVKAMRYIFNILISLDQLANTLLGGDPDETMSSRMGKRIASGNCWGCYRVCRILHFIDKDHCRKSIEEDEGKDGVIK